MSELDDLEEDIGEYLETPPDPIGEYIGERNEQNERHGKGWAILPNGDQYDGQYRKGIRHGRGLYVFKDGARYLGQYRCGLRFGYGKFIYPDGSIYEGNWRRNLKHGKGTYIYCNGDTYTGNWYKGLRHGVGRYTWKECDLSFDGTWKNGVRVGPCIVNYPKFKFHGNWDYKWPQGPGVFNFGERYILKGYYKSEALFTTAQLIACEKGDNYSFLDKEDEEKIIEEDEQEELEEEKPSMWVSQTMEQFQYSQLPLQPVSLPLSDSELSICALDSEPVIPSPESPILLSPVYIEMEEAEIQEELIVECETESEHACDFDLEKRAK